jgi:outer membrane protein TolC
VQVSCAKTTVSAALYLIASGLAGCGAPQNRLSTDDLMAITGSLSATIEVLEEPLTGPLDIHDAVARALKYNLSIRAQELTAEIAFAKVRAENATMLPDVVAESRYYGRNAPSYSRSSSSSNYSTSSDARGLARDLTLSFNLLDFGLAYLRTEQATDKAEKEREEVRRVATRVVEETRAAFWRTAAYDALTAQLDRVRPAVEQMLLESWKASNHSEIDPLVSINYERDVLNLQRELNQLRVSLAGSAAEFRQLIGVPQSTPIQLRTAARGMRHLAAIDTPASSDIMRALGNRHEIRQLMLDMRITEKEVHATILQLLPSVSLSRGLSSDTSSYLLNANWVSFGAKVAWNLMNLAQLPRNLDVVEAQMRAHRQQAVATAATIAMQVYVAHARVSAHRQASRDAMTLASVQQRMLRQVRAASTVGTVSAQVLVKERLATLLADVRARLAEADLEGALAAYETSVGVDQLAELEVQAMSVPEVAEVLRLSEPRSWPATLVSAANMEAGKRP